MRILHPLQRSLELPVQAPGRVELRCKLSVPDAPVRWFKDGLEVDETDNLLVLAEGAWRCLLIPVSSAEDAGEYICESKDEAVSFDVKVSGQQRPRSKEVLMGLRPAGSFPAWVRGTCSSVVMEPVGAHPPGAGPPSVGARLGLAAEASLGPCCPRTALHHSHATILAELPVRILQPRRPPPIVTVSPGETVTLGCELSRADAPVRWAKEGVRLEAGGSLVLEEEGAYRRLLIPAARAEHSGKYVCSAADDTVTFTVQVSGEQEAGGEPGGGCWVRRPRQPQLCWCWVLQTRWSGSWRGTSCRPTDAAGPWRTWCWRCTSRTPTGR